MKKGSIQSLIAAIIVLLSACAGKMQPYDLSYDYAKSLHYEGTEGVDSGEEEEEKSDLVGVPALSFYGGDLKRGGIWWAGKDIDMEKGEVFIFDATNVGKDSIPFGATFPPIDLLKETVQLKISARAVGLDSTVTPVLYLQVDDVEGYKSNAKWPSQTIENSESFKDYYFDLKDIYVQNSPKKHKVNGTMINSLKFFINPGQTGYTGQIFIKEIKIVPVVKP